MTERELFYNCIVTIRHLKRSVIAFREGNEDRGIRIYRVALKSFQSLILAGFIPPEEAKPLLVDLASAMEAEDYILFADIIELNVLPMVVALCELIRQEIPVSKRRGDYLDQNLEVLAKSDSKLAGEIASAFEKLEWFSAGGEARVTDRGEAFSYLAGDGTEYHIDETPTGNFSFRIVREGKNCYLVSNGDPVEAAERYVKTQLGDSVPENVILVGLELGNVVDSLIENTLGESRIWVFEPDLNVLAIVLKHVDFKTRFPRCNFIWDPTMEKFSKRLQSFCAEKDLLLIQRTALAGIGDRKIQDTIRQFYIRENSERNAEKLLAVNFRSNMSCAGIRPVEELSSKMKDRDVFIIAAGPSLDRNISQLKNRGENDFILATGTVYIKLMRMGIRPDAIIVTDPNNRVVRQIREYYEEQIPMILLSTAARGYARKYQGPKYYLLQNGYRAAEEMAVRNGNMLVETGGSVSTTALDLALKSNPKRIVFLGLDLAFSDNLAHADDTSNQIAPDAERLTPVKAWDGQGTVMTDDKFTIYRKWISDRLLKPDADHISVINATEGGSFVQGMQHILLKKARE